MTFLISTMRPFWVSSTSMHQRKRKSLPTVPAPWISEAVIKVKQARGRAERKKRKTGLVIPTEVYKQARSDVTKVIKHTEASHFHAKLEDGASESEKMFSLLITLLNREDRSDFLPGMIPQEPAESFSQFFQEKSRKLGKRLMMIR